MPPSKFLASPRYRAETLASLVSTRRQTCTNPCWPARLPSAVAVDDPQIHVILSGALKRAVRWQWLSTNTIEHAEPPPQTAANLELPSREEAGRILNKAWSDPDWAVLVWLTMVTGFRRGELCALRWNDLCLGRARPGRHPVALDSAAGHRAPWPTSWAWYREMESK